MPAIGGDEPMSLEAAAYDVLHALAARLAAESETIAERYVAALRADGRFPGARALPAVQLRDHVTPFIGLIASQLMIIGETRGSAPELLADGAQLRRAMSELHGTQRHRLGWSESDIEREDVLLATEVERALESALAGGPEPSSAAALDALEYAKVAVRQMLEQGSRTTIRSHRFAKSTATP
jgi:hypothetical protein